MKIEATNYDITISVERREDLTIGELFEMFYTITLGLTFTHEQWENTIIDLAEEIEINKAI